MIPVRSFSGKRVALFGLGGSGVATAKALLAGGAELTAFDDSPDSIEKARQEGVPTGDLRELDWTGLAALVLAPGVPLTHPKPHWSAMLAKDAGVPIVGDVELFARERRAFGPTAPFIAITGTNGKSTTTALIAHMLHTAGKDVQMGGNIGRAVLTLDPPAEGRHYVVECSSYQIDLAPGLDPTVGILLNITPDHLDRHGNIENYAAIKAQLVHGSDHAIVGIDDVYGKRLSDSLLAEGREPLRISTTQHLGTGLFADGNDIVLALEPDRRVIASLDGIGSLRGRHNAQNAMAAIGVCLKLGLEEDIIREGLRTFPGLAHRMEQVARIGKTLFINDSKATNAEAAAPALSSFDHVRWIAGGLPKEGGIEALSPLFERVEKAYLIGEAAPGFAASLGEKVCYEISDTLNVAVAHAARDADEAGGGVVLLSPACASFDQFRNFEVRGDAFRAAVLALPGAEPIGGDAQ
ncbi:UDP-N-acetylmuramoyl-L-alanine--D-glutamate ligase [Notoacmeibacter sp. MSK16QG-6]|uniref:UDP-N-acetylmuramoyl-L-alanine--D-glutamate ligase n=1 Tax=Notoacmeibacter sp. MSK16QG-6 TaxID=2957982 RepID=UPI00209CE7A8|nr:UDP-N-acetylmuramoyl-L-alanine--D-glutamate ligase [Notoacmeibacter sp. MSK16QG-6]MCP1199704.1 UDP-N-acetylmuramoyl-L-alanine--D-glutamate ligase [Notoacmeibacter sp. MSK16QG-6]